VHDSVTLHMNAPPERVWDLVSDVTRIGRYSPETFEAEWLEGATGPAVGARFRGHVRRNQKGPVYWTTCTVTESDPGKTFGCAPHSSASRQRWNPTKRRDGHERHACSAPPPQTTGGSVDRPAGTGAQ